MNRSQVKKYISWDIDTWAIALRYWKKQLEGRTITKGLELGCNQGGISLFFITELGIPMVCSDLSNPEQKVSSLHPETRNNPLITFQAVNGLDIAYPDNSFDLVVFKSVVGHMSTPELQQKFISEIYRVLKPGGTFCFVENCKGGFLHQAGRKYFIRWGKSWRYISLDEMHAYLHQFSKKEIKTTGFFTAFTKNNLLRRIAFIFDRLILPLIPASRRYVMYGTATK